MISPRKKLSASWLMNSKRILDRTASGRWSRRMELRRLLRRVGCFCCWFIFASGTRRLDADQSIQGSGSEELLLLLATIEPPASGRMKEPTRRGHNATAVCFRFGFASFRRHRNELFCHAGTPDFANARTRQVAQPPPYHGAPLAATVESPT